MSTEKPAPPAIPEPEIEPGPISLIRESLVELQASLPDKLDISKEAFEQFLLNLSLCREPIAFEILGTHKRVSAQFVAGDGDAPLLRRQLQAYFPEAVFVPRDGALEQAWNACQGDEMLAVEFGLKNEFMLPLASGRLDPFIGIVGALAELQPGELGMFQVLFQSVHEPWAESIVRSVTHADGGSFGTAASVMSMPITAKSPLSSSQMSGQPQHPTVCAPLDNCNAYPDGKCLRYRRLTSYDCFNQDYVIARFEHYCHMIEEDLETIPFTSTLPADA